MQSLETVSVRRSTTRYRKRIKVRIKSNLVEYYLMEKLNVIKKELGMDKGGKDKTVDKFRKRAEKVAMPEHIKVVFEEVLRIILTK
jgi:ATP-dependent Lon protease